MRTLSILTLTVFSLLSLSLTSCKKKSARYDRQKKGAMEMKRRAPLAQQSVPLREKHNTESYDTIQENEFLRVADQSLSTFSIDVDTAAYSNIRRMIKQGKKPPHGLVRIEEMVNYFSYNYPSPKGPHPFSIHTTIASCPWNLQHRLFKIGIQAKKVSEEDRPATNLVFLMDVSGSMFSRNKLPLLKDGFALLTQQLRPIDRVAIVVYAGASGLVLPSTPGSAKGEILQAIGRLRAGGSTNGGQGIRLAYKVARENFVKKGINRVILATDGDFNVGTTNRSELVRMVQKEAKSGVFLTVLGFGRGNYKDDMMEEISNKGNGNYAYIDSQKEARKVLGREVGGTLMTVAKDVKIQVEFNPTRVQSYRLLGYENRLLKAEDFDDDTKDAGEIGAGHRVTALYEVVPVGVKPPTDRKQPNLKYQKTRKLSEEAKKQEMATVKVRYKQPDGDKSTLIEKPVPDRGVSFDKTTADFQFAASVVAFAMLLRNSKYKGTANYDLILELARAGRGKDPNGYRDEFYRLVQKARGLQK